MPKSSVFTAPKGKSKRVVLLRTGKEDFNTHVKLYMVKKAFNLLKPSPDDYITEQEVQALVDDQSIDVEIQGLRTT